MFLLAGIEMLRSRCSCRSYGFRSGADKHRLVRETENRRGQFWPGRINVDSLQLARRQAIPTAWPRSYFTFCILTKLHAPSKPAKSFAGPTFFPGLDRMDFTDPLEALLQLPNAEFHVVGNPKEPRLIPGHHTAFVVCTSLEVCSVDLQFRFAQGRKTVQLCRVLRVVRVSFHA